MTAPPPSAGADIGRPRRWRVLLDQGGTFTDGVARDPGGAVTVVKVPSGPGAPLSAIRALLGLTLGEPIPPCDVRMGTTVATNALLTRSGAPTALVVSAGFEDILAIGDQTRPDLFALDIRRPAPLPAAVVGVPHRGAPDGRELAAGALDEARLRSLVSEGVRSAAVVVLHGTRAPGLERGIGERLREWGFTHVALSHEVDPAPGLLARAETTVADAALTPLLAEYVAELQAALPGSRISFMQSGGALAPASRFRGRDAVLSGPAGGVVALGEVARLAGVDRAIGFDMGGTSTDVSRHDGEPDVRYESAVAGVRVRAPVMAIHTIAAGGGSLCRYDGRRLRVGPESAGAEPGPVAYGRGGRTPTLTDANLVLGRLPPGRFPIPLDTGAARAALGEVAKKVGRSVEETAAGFVAVANEAMAEAIREVSVARGHDVRDHALVVFGGAGGQHACEVARLLGIRRVVAHPLAGVLSAFGMGAAEEGWHGERDLGDLEIGRSRGGPAATAAPSPSTPLSPPTSLRPSTPPSPDAVGASAERALGRALESLSSEGGSALDDRPIGAARARVDLHYEGTAAALTMELPRGRAGGAGVPAGGLDLGALVAAFERRHRKELGYARPGHPIRARVARLELTVSGDLVDEPAREPTDEPPRPPEHWEVALDGARRPVPLLSRENTPPDQRFDGPAVFVEDTSTFWIPEGFVGVIGEHGLLTLEDRADAPLGQRAGDGGEARDASTGAADDHAAPDPMTLEILENAFMSIAGQMGAALERTAMSVNIRERRDFSCALFDAGGGLVANAPHIPVHLGAMGETVAHVIRAHLRPEAGDVFVSNDPAAGGSHLPDITVVTPVFVGADVPRFYVANRGHHADVGGISPGSMPPFSRTLAEEGVIFRAARLVRGGVFAREETLATLSAGAYPARRPAENLADLEAQVAANHKGATLLEELCARFGTGCVSAMMAHAQDAAAADTRAAILTLPDGESVFEDTLDDGARIRASVRIEGDTLTVDFAGTSPELAADNLNAPRAVTVAALMYVLRVLAGAGAPGLDAGSEDGSDDEAPRGERWLLNAGCLRPVTLNVPPGSLLDPGAEAPVAGGNVETSQRVVDVLLAALGLKAASQGTMNNVSFGDARFGHYETLAGGDGASARADGASAVHTHMTNSRITDPETLEARFPVRVVRFARRPRSGGDGARRGGDGLVREYEALAPLTFSVLSQRRTTAPFGLCGGEPGARGENVLVRASTGEPEALGGRASVELEPGDRVVIRTPGGGGHGAVEAPKRAPS